MGKRGKHRRKPIPPELRYAIWLEWDGRCALCHGRVQFALMTIDHRRCLAAGGTDDPSNLQPAHATCNIHKSGHADRRAQKRFRRAMSRAA